MFKGPIALLMLVTIICTTTAGFGVLERQEFLEATMTGAACSAAASILTLINAEMKNGTKAEMFRETECRLKVLRERIINLGPTPREERSLQYQTVFQPIYDEIAVQQAESKYFPLQWKVRAPARHQVRGRGWGEDTTE